MKKWITANKLHLAGAIVGAIAGYLYWYYIGCLTGTCAITSNPWRSTFYFAAMGALIFGLFKKDIKNKNKAEGNSTV